LTGIQPVSALDTVIGDLMQIRPTIAQIRPDVRANGSRR